MMGVNAVRGAGVHNRIRRYADSAVRGINTINFNEADDGCYKGIEVIQIAA